MLKINESLYPRSAPIYLADLSSDIENGAECRKKTVEEIFESKNTLTLRYPYFVRLHHPGKLRSKKTCKLLIFLV
jgi:hypothetical protein